MLLFFTMFKCCICKNEKHKHMQLEHKSKQTQYDWKWEFYSLRKCGKFLQLDANPSMRWFQIETKINGNEK
jgi:hypothetical protein